MADLFHYSIFIDPATDHLLSIREKIVLPAKESIAIKSGKQKILRQKKRSCAFSESGEQLRG